MAICLTKKRKGDIHPSPKSKYMVGILFPIKINKKTGVVKRN
jgi:hypothetical protein